MTDWIRSQRVHFEQLLNSNVDEWQAIEMALNEASTPEALVWHDKSVPMLQLLALFALVDSQWIRISTYQDDDEFGLSIESILSSPQELCQWADQNDETSIFRWRRPCELPTGRISQPEVKQNDRNNIATVEFKIQGRLIRLAAGEVYENQDQSFDIKLMDESVLVQVDGRFPMEPQEEPA